MASFEQNPTIDVLIEEYRSVTEEILKRLEFQQKLLNYELLTTGAILSVLIQIALTPDLSAKAINATKYFIVLIPYVFLFFAWSFSRHDIMIIALANYKEKIIRPSLRQLTGNDQVLGYEEYLSEFRKIRRKHYGVLVKIEQGTVLPLLVCAVLIAIYLYCFVVQEINGLVSWEINSLIRIALCCGSMALLAITSRLGFIIPGKYISIPGEGPAKNDNAG